MDSLTTCPPPSPFVMDVRPSPPRTSRHRLRHSVDTRDFVFYIRYWKTLKVWVVSVVENRWKGFRTPKPKSSVDSNLFRVCVEINPLDCSEKKGHPIRSRTCVRSLVWFRCLVRIGILIKLFFFRHLRVNIPTVIWVPYLEQKVNEVFRFFLNFIPWLKKFWVISRDCSIIRRTNDDKAVGYHHLYGRESINSPDMVYYI